MLNTIMKLMEVKEVTMMLTPTKWFNNLKTNKIMKKNIHIIQTDKLSKLYVRNDVTPPFYSNFQGKPVNIYITTDEEINQKTKPCWCINTIKNTWNKDLIYYQGVMPQYYFVGFKKIILTTDQDLIKEGVQSIDDEFLEWFVAHPSCEEVKIVEDKKISKKEIFDACEGDLVYDTHGCGGTINSLSDDIRVGIDNYIEFAQTSDNGHETLNICGYKIYDKCYKIIIPKEEPKQETLEERVSNSFVNNKNLTSLEIAEIGAKWQKEKMYSEKDMKQFATWLIKINFNYTSNVSDTFKKWFNNLKRNKIMKQTAVDWLIEEVECRGIITKELRLAFNQAKGMEKQQIIDTYIIADSESTQEESEHNALKFYEKTYGSKGTDAKDVVLGYKTSLDAQMLDSQLPQTTSDKWKEYQDWLNEVPELSNEEIWKGAIDYTKVNLDVTTYRNGDVIPQVTDPTQWANLTTGAWCYYDNDAANGPIYGKLYNWYAVNDVRGLAPVGYHIPTDKEMNLLNLADNPTYGGTRNVNGSFGNVGLYGFWWSSTEYNTTNAWFRYLYYYSSNVFSYSNTKSLGFSVRCVRDDKN